MTINQIIQYQLPPEQYHAVVYPKKQIVLHHTASGPSEKGNIDYWKSDAARIATPFVIGHDGEIYQAFSSKYYAAHLGCPAPLIKSLGFKDYATRCDTLHKESIGIELTCWGGLTKNSKGQWQSYAKVVVPDQNVQVYPEGFRGYKAYEKYTPAQLESLKNLLVYLCDTYKIDRDYKCDMWDISKHAIGGENGIWTHCSYRIASDKQDCHPQPELINLLKSLV